MDKNIPGAQSKRHKKNLIEQKLSSALVVLSRIVYSDCEEM